MLQTILEKIPDIIEAAALIIGGFAVIATMTPTQADDKIVNALVKGIHFLALNFGKAKNAEPK